MIIFKKIAMVLTIICLGLFTISCSAEEEITSTEVVDLSEELKIIEAFGLVKAEESKDIIIDFPAVVEEVLVNEGQRVSLNEPILTLDLSLYEAQILDKENEINIAKLEYKRLNKSLKGLSIENKDIAINKLKSELDFSEKIYEQVLKDFESTEKLYEAGAVSQETLNQSMRSVDETKKSLDNIEYELLQAISRKERELEQFHINKDLESDQVRIQEERILQIENNLSTLKGRLNKSYISANQIISEYESAAIHDISYAAGHMTDSTRKAFSIVNLESLIIEANVVEEFIRDVKAGTSVRIVPIADRTREYKGTVAYISQMAFNKNGETIVPVRISIDNIDSFLLPNYNVDVYINAQ